MDGEPGWDGTSFVGDWLGEGEGTGDWVEAGTGGVGRNVGEVGDWD